MDAEELCRAALVAFDLIEYAAHMVALELLERHPALELRRAVARAAQLLGQIMTVNHVGLGENRGTLDGVLELAHVARPAIIDDQPHRAFRETHRGSRQ